MLSPYSGARMTSTNTTSSQQPKLLPEWDSSFDVVGVGSMRTKTGLRVRTSQLAPISPSSSNKVNYLYLVLQACNPSKKEKGGILEIF